MEGVSASEPLDPICALTCEAKAAELPAVLLMVSDASVFRDPPILANTSLC